MALKYKVPRVDGRVFLITGANTGIGRVTATQLADAGGKVFLAGRSQERTQPVVDEINAAHGEGRATYLKLDLASLDSVRACAQAFRDTGEPLHVLINNAGVAGLCGETQEGYESMFGINHIGHFVLTLELLDLLRDAEPARIVTVASRAHTRVDGIDYDVVESPTKTRTGFPEYCVSKLANVWFSAELGKRLEGTGITTYALHPGVVASDVWREVPWPFRSVMKMFMISNEEGAMTTLYCATAPEVTDHTGRYYDECKEKAASKAGRDAESARDLFERSLA